MRLRSLPVFLAAALCLPSLSFASPLLTSVTPNSWTFQLTDGTSNTILFGETTRYSLCLPRTVTSGITDGTSNTLMFGESTGVRLWWTSRFNGIADGTSNTILFLEESPLECFDGTRRPDPLIDEINDGTSNTIVFGENPFELGGEGFDACFTGVNLSISDGTSNTVLFGENRCFQDVRLGGTVRVVVPAPPVTAVLAMALSAWGLRRRARR